ACRQKTATGGRANESPAGRYPLKANLIATLCKRAMKLKIGTRDWQRSDLASSQWMQSSTTGKKERLDAKQHLLKPELDLLRPQGRTGDNQPASHLERG